MHVLYVCPSQRVSVGFWVLSSEETQGGQKIRVSSLLLKLFPPNYNDGALGEWRTLEALHSCPALPPPSHDCILTLLPQQPSAEDTHTHRDTHCHAQMHTFKHQTCSSYKAGLYSLGRVYALYVFAPVCVYIGVCMCAWTLVFPLSSGLPTTNIAPSLFPSFSLPLFCCTNPLPPHPSHYGPWKTSTTFPPDPNAHLTKMLHPHMWL